MRYQPALYLMVQQPVTGFKKALTNILVEQRSKLVQESVSERAVGESEQKRSHYASNNKRIYRGYLQGGAH